MRVKVVWTSTYQTINNLKWFDFSVNRSCLSNFQYFKTSRKNLRIITHSHSVLLSPPVIFPTLEVTQSTIGVTTPSIFTTPNLKLAFEQAITPMENFLDWLDWRKLLPVLRQSFAFCSYLCPTVPTTANECELES